MKKLVTKILFAVFAFSAVGQNFAQAETVNQLNTTTQTRTMRLPETGSQQSCDQMSTAWQSVRTGAQEIGSVGSEVISRAGNRLSWLASSIVNSGKKLFFACTHNMPDSQSLKINKKYIFAGVAGLAVAGGIAYLISQLNPQYEELYNAIHDQCSAAHNEEESRYIFEQGVGKIYIPKWYSLRRKVTYMRGFVTYCKGKDDKVLADVTNYLTYLEKPWLTKRNLIKIGAGAIAGIALTFKLDKKSPNGLSTPDFYQDNYYLG